MMSLNYSSLHSLSTLLCAQTNSELRAYMSIQFADPLDAPDDADVDRLRRVVADYADMRAAHLRLATAKVALRERLERMGELLAMEGVSVQLPWK